MHDFHQAKKPQPIVYACAFDLEAAGLAMLWVAAALTLVTGWDYLRKGLAHLSKEGL